MTKGTDPTFVAAMMSGNLVNMMIAASAGGIERQEAEGQAAMLASPKTTLPRKLGYDCSRAQLEALGFVFGDNEDDLFVFVQYPAGWKLEGTNHSMWSDLLDDQGRRRAGVFYKAAFYDRDAHLSMSCRFSLRNHAETGTEDVYSCQVEADGGFKKSFGEYARKDYARLDVLEAEAKQWLAENYPEWKSPFAYWDVAVEDIKA